MFNLELRYDRKSNSARSRLNLKKRNIKITQVKFIKSTKIQLDRRRRSYFNFYFYIQIIVNIFKFHHQKLAIDNSYTLLYMKFFIKIADFANLKKGFLI